jgi:outer membrane protein assembly factor BamB
MAVLRAFVVLPFLCAPLVAQSEWTMWRSNLRRNAHVSGRGNLPSPTVRWQAGLNGLPEGSAVVADVDLDGMPDIVTTAYNEIAALKGATGEFIWRKPQEGQFNIGSAAIADLDGDGKPEVVHGWTAGKVNCRNGQTGELKWQVDVKSKVWSSPAIVDADRDGRPDVVISSEQKVHVLRGDTGQEIWSAYLGFNMFGSPAVADVDGDGDLDVVCGGSHVYCFDAKTGAQVWQAANKQAGEATCLIEDLDGDGTMEVVYSIDGKEIGCLDGKTGKIEWIFPISNRTQGLHSSPCAADANGDGILEVYAGTAAGIMYCLNGKSGQKIWEYQHSNEGNFKDYIEGSSSLGDVDGDGALELLFGTHNRYMYCLDARTGRLEWSFLAAPGGEGKVVSTPTLADVDLDGVFEVIVSANGGGLWCLGAAGPAGPTVRITAPVDLSVVSGQVKISAVTTGNVARVEFFVDGAPLSTDPTAPYESSWNSTTAANGAHKIRAVASDSAGKTAAHEISVTVRRVSGGLAGPWPVWRKDLGNTGYQSQPGALKNPIQWYKSPVGLGESTPACGDVDGDGALEVVSYSYSGLMTCIDAKSGTRKWQKQIGPKDINISSVTLADLGGDGSVEALVVNKAERRLYVVNAATGDVKWTYNLGGDGMTTAVVADVNDDGTAEIVVAGDKLYCLKSDGSGVVWTNGANGSHVAPAIADVDGDGTTDVVVSTFGKAVSVIDGKTGATKFEVDSYSGGYIGGTNNTPAAADIDGDGAMDIVVCSARRGIFRINGKTRQVVWAFRWPETSMGWMCSPALGDLNGDGVMDVVAGSGTPDHKIYAVDGKTGKQIWAYQAGSWLEPSAVICDLDGDGKNDVLYRSYDGFLYWFEGATGAVKWKFEFTAKSGNAACSPMCVDVDGDGYVEIIQQESTGSVHVFGNDPSLQTGPTVSITAPANNAIVSKVVKIAATATGGAIARVDFLIDGAVVGSDLAAPYEFEWDSRTVADGTHAVRAVAIDGADRTGSASVTVKVANADQPPAVSMTAPSNNAVVSGQVSIQASASDDFGVTRVEFFVDGASIGSDTTAPYQATWDSAGASNGAHTIRAVATDTAGQTAQAQVAVTVSNATGDAAPTVSITAPANNASVSGSVRIAATATDDKGVTKVEFFVDGALIATDTAAPYETSWTATPGAHTIRAVATDTAGQTATASVSVSGSTGPGPTRTLTFTAASTGHAWETDGKFYIGGNQVRSGSDSKGKQFLGALRFDLTGIPAEATIVELQVELTGAWTNWSIPASSGYTLRLMPDSVAEGWSGLRFPTLQAATPAGSFSPSIAASGLGSGLVNRVALASPGAIGSKVAIRIDGPATSTNSAYAWHGVAASNANYRPRLIVKYSDSAAPSVTITAPAGGATVKGSVAVRATVQGAADRVEFFIDDVSIGQDAAAPYEVAWDTTTGADGPRKITARATSGGVSGEASIQVTVRNADAPPTVSISSPASNATVQGTVNIAAVAGDDNGVASVRFFVDGNAAGEDPAPPYQIAWDSRTAANGAHTIRAVATDTAGQTAAAQITVNVNNGDAPPTVSLTAPADGAKVSGNVAIRAAAADDKGVAKVEFLVDGAVVGQAASAPFETTWNSATAPDGVHTIAARAVDTSGQTAQAAITVTVDNVDSPPTISITAPSSGATVSGTITIKASAADDRGVAKVEFIVDTTLLSTDTAAPYEAVWATSSAADGTRTLSAVVTDSAGQTARADVTVVVKNASQVRSIALTAVDSGHAWEKDGRFYAGRPEIRSGEGSDDRLLYGLALFDLSTLPAGATITELQLELTGNWSSVGLAPGAQWAAQLMPDSVASTWASLNYAAVRSAAPAGAFAPTVGVSALGSLRVNRFTLASPQAAGSRLAVRIDGSRVASGQSVYSWHGASASVASRRPKLTVKYLDAAPVVAITNPAGLYMGEVQAEVSGQVTIQVEASDDVGVREVQIFVNGTQVARHTSAPYDAAWDTTRLPNGPHTIKAIAIDTSGQSSAALRKCVVNNDRAAPAVKVASPRNGELVKGKVTVKAEATDDTGVTETSLLVDGLVIQTLTSAPFEFAWDTTGVSDGPHSLKVVAKDGAGNASQSSVSVVVANSSRPPAGIARPRNPAGGAPPRGAGAGGIGGIHIRIRFRR